MIIVMKSHASEESINHIKNVIELKGLESHISYGKEVAIIGVIGDKAQLQDQNIEIFEGVDKIVPVTESYKLANRKFQQSLAD